jgi:hypothetical protein
MLILLLIAALATAGWGAWTLHTLWSALPRRNDDLTLF